MSLKSGTMLLADRGYDADRIGALVRQRGAWANIPPKRNRIEALCFSPCPYRSPPKEHGRDLPFDRTML
jgi:hypothetical protein